MSLTSTSWLKLSPKLPYGLLCHQYHWTIGIYNYLIANIFTTIIVASNYHDYKIPLPTIMVQVATKYFTQSRSRVGIMRAARAVKDLILSATVWMVYCWRRKYRKVASEFVTKSHSSNLLVILYQCSTGTPCIVFNTHSSPLWGLPAELAQIAKFVTWDCRQSILYPSPCSHLLALSPFIPATSSSSHSSQAERSIWLLSAVPIHP